MQKVLRRTILADKQAARRLARRKDKATREWAKTTREQANYNRRDEINQIKAARLARREDWELGALAPKRDVGDAKHTYGTINSMRTKAAPLDYRKKDEILKQVGGRYLNIVKDDRVVLIEGRDKGKIGKITSVDASRGSCTVEGLNMVDVAVPQWMVSAEDPEKRPVRTIEQPVPLTSVRLVYPLTSPETGETKDVIIKKLVNVAFYKDRESRTTFWRRIIPGLNITIPWPKVEPKDHEDHDCDTLRLDVEVRSFVPTLLRPPMPMSVIDELRNKYSKFRTRHDPEYIEAKMKEDREKEEKKRQIEEMRTPLNEINRRERKLRKAKGKPVLTAEMLERMGRLIAQKRRLSLNVEPRVTGAIEA